MNTSDQAKQIFLEAVEKENVEASLEFLAQATAKNDKLRAQVDLLWEAHQKAGQFLGGDAALPTTNAMPSVSERTGDAIGPYKLLQQIGEGGFGVVYMAEQTEPVRRKVALKIIKPGMDTKEVVARFEAERQALALMDHPNIAKILDGGATNSGRPFFVMELVRGVPLTEFCDENRLDITSRLNLFRSVCQAIQHAHQKGVIHRDIKPSNVMVTLHDAEPVAKVIDFGVSKAISQQLTEKTMFTAYGQMIGTPQYMSPEQAALSGMDVDTRSDVYSLGVLLYELLTGSTPLDPQALRKTAYAEVQRIIREVEPQKPSTRLGSLGEQTTSVADRRGCPPSKLISLTRGELDWIVMKALEKARSRRYGSATELGEDVARFLNSQPVMAGPPSLIYRFRKFAARNKGKLAWCGGMAALLIAAAGWIYVEQQGRQERIRERGQRVSERLEAASLALGRAASAPVGSHAEWIAARGAKQRLDDLLVDGPLSKADKQRVQEFRKHFDEEEIDRRIAEQIEEALISGATHPDLESWTQMEVDLRGLFASLDLDLDRIEPMEIARRIRAHNACSRLSDALELWIGTRAQLSALGGPQATAANMQPWAEAMYAADRDSVRTGIRRLLYSGRPFTAKQVDAVADGADLNKLSPRTLSWLGNLYLAAGAPEQGDQVLNRALQLYPSDFMVNFDFAYMLDNQGRLQEAVRYYMRCLALRPNAAGIWQSMGIALRKLKELKASKSALLRAVELRPDYTPAKLELTRSLLIMEEFELARGHAERALELSPNNALAHGMLGRVFMSLEQYELALPELEKCHQLGQAQRMWREPSKAWLDECRQKLKTKKSGSP